MNLDLFICKSRLINKRITLFGLIIVFIVFLLTIATHIKLPSSNNPRYIHLPDGYQQLHEGSPARDFRSPEVK